MESENKEKYIFYDLTPTNDVSLDIYEDAINFSLKNNKILNAAISGSYGSGKSSLLESYRKKHPEKRFIHISLTHFNSMENENNKIEKKATGVNNNTREEENNENKNNKSLVTMLEAKILNQLIHQISYEKIPQTYFKTKRKFTEKELENSTLQILLFIISFLYVIYFNKWYDFVLTLSDETILYSFFKITTYSYFRLVGASFLFYLLWELIYKVLKIQKTKNFFKKLNIQGNEFEIAGDNDDSYFDKYLNEVMYLFENSGVDVIVFEDIDRYEISEIFERLREVNRLVNNKLKEEGKTLKFFYLLKDDIFISKDRTKFFDFIIPVIPVVDGSNSYDKFIELFKNINQYNFDDSFLYNLSLYIDDMRLLKNIYNEFIIYYRKLNEIEDNSIVDSNKILSIIVYKNLFPKDFSDLQLNQGFVYNLFFQKEKFIEERIKEIDFQIATLNEPLKNMQELDILYNYYSSHTSSYSEQGIKSKDWIDKEYPERKKNLTEKEKKIPKKTIDELEKKRKELKNYPLKEIIAEGNMDNIFNNMIYENELGKINKFENVKGNPYFKLLKFLIRKGYLDEGYSLYMAYFYGKSDKNFLMGVLNKEKLEYDYKLDNPNLVIDRINVTDFKEVEILNFDSLSCLLKLNSDNYKDRKENLFIQLKETKNFDFINSYLKLDNLEEIHRKNFTALLYFYWETFFLEVKNSKNLSENDLYMFVMDILQFSKKEDLEVINKNNNIIEYIENKKNFLNYTILSKEYIDILENSINIFLNNSIFFKNLKILDIKLKEIEYIEELDKASLYRKIFIFVYKNSLYELNFNNIALMIRKILYYLNEEAEKDKLSDEKLKEKNYTLINKSNESKQLQDYLEKHIDKYAEIILENCEGKIEEEEEFIIKFLNFEDIVDEKKQKYIEFLANNITDFSGIDDKNLWNIFLSKKKAEYSEKNIITYFKENGFNEILIQFINLKLKKLSYKEFNFEEEDKSTFFIEVLKCYELDNEVYENILETLEYNNEAEITFPENIPEEKVDILTKLSIIKINPDNLKFIRSYYKNNLNNFIKLNLENYIKIIDIYNNLFSPEELLAILSDEEIDVDSKLKLLSFSNQKIKIMNKDYPAKVQNYILENNYDSSEFLELIENFNNFEEKTQEIIFDIIKNNINNFYSNLDKAPSSLINKFLKNKEIDNEIKLTILINLLNFIKEIETFYKYLKLVNSKDYKDLVKRNTNFNININEFNLQLLQKLKEKGFIESFSQINESIYEVITIKDKEKFID